MALQNFDYPTDWGSSMDLEQSVLTARFGNGYEQSVGDGMNPTRQVWTFSLFGNETYILPAVDFLEAHTGKTFLWTRPLRGTSLRVKATDIKLVSNNGAAYTLTAKFTQSFSPT